MFNNIGKKIKSLTKVVCWIGIGVCVLTGIILCATDDDLAAVGVPIMLGGPLFCWLGSFLMYGFGELVDKAESIEKLLLEGAYDRNFRGHSNHDENSGYSLSEMSKAEKAGSKPAGYRNYSTTAQDKKAALLHLLDKGLITQAEYNKKVDELL